MTLYKHQKFTYYEDNIEKHYAMRPSEREDFARLKSLDYSLQTIFEKITGHSTEHVIWVSYHEEDIYMETIPKRNVVRQYNGEPA
jgi:hypothetical protein